MLIPAIGAGAVGAEERRGGRVETKKPGRQGSSGLGELGENRWPSAPMGGLAFRTRNSPSQKTSLRWGDCCPPNSNPASSSVAWKHHHQDMPPVPVWGCPPLLRDCTSRGFQRYTLPLSIVADDHRVFSREAYWCAFRRLKIPLS